MPLTPLTYTVFYLYLNILMFFLVFFFLFRFDLFLKLLWPSFSYFAVGMVELLLTIELVREKVLKMSKKI